MLKDFAEEHEAYEWTCTECDSAFWTPRKLVMFHFPDLETSCPYCDSNCSSPKKVKLQVVKED